MFKNLYAEEKFGFSMFCWKFYVWQKLFYFSFTLLFLLSGNSHQALDFQSSKELTPQHFILEKKFGNKFFLFIFFGTEKCLLSLISKSIVCRSRHGIYPASNILGIWFLSKVTRDNKESWRSKESAWTRDTEKLQGSSNCRYDYIWQWFCFETQ